MNDIFFKDWDSIIRIIIVSVLAYIAMVAMLRISGKRTLAKMNAFDWVVTFALGSSLATVSLNKQVALAEGVLFIGLLILFQYIITAWYVRSDKAEKVVTGKPTLILYQGEFLEDVMKKERVSKNDIKYKLRKQGKSDFSSIYAVVLETSGDVSIISSMDIGKQGTLKNVENFGIN